MAVETTVTNATFTGTGVSSTYSTGFYANSSDQVKVYVDDILKTIGDDYVVNNVGLSVGCDIVATFTLGSSVYVERVTPITQLVDTQNNETILEDVLDGEFDKLTMIAQEINERLNRALFFAPGGDSGSSLVGFKQAGTGAISRTVQDKLREIVSIEDFGATAALADASSKVQAAIDSLPATGGVVVFHTIVNVKDIKVNGTLRDKQNVILRGCGIGTGMKVPNGAMTTLTRVNLIDGEGAIGCRVEDMTLDGNRANQVIPVLVDGPDYEKFNLVYLEGSQDCAVAGCNILNAPVIGICPGAPWTGKTGADRTRIERNIFKGCSVPVAAMRQRKSFIDSNVIYGTSETYAIVVDEFSAGNVVSNNDISDTLDGAIFLFRATDNQVLGNRVTNSLVSILLSDAANDNLIANNDCDTSSNSHIKIINGCLRNTVRDNVLETASQYCIVCEAGTGGSSYTIISGNRCRLASFSNIAIFNAAFTIIEDNYCYEAVGSGIYVSGACDWSEINDNYCYNNSTGSANDAGIRLVAQNNITVENNKCFDSQGAKTQNWGIRCNESFVGTVAITNNDVRQNKTAGMAITGGTPIVKGNLGWITEAVGQVALGAAATALTVTHGMDMQPDFRTVRVTFLDTTVRNSKVMYVANVGATTFEIRVDAAPGTATNITWEARQSI